MATAHDREFTRICKRLGVVPFVSPGIASEEELQRHTVAALVEAVALLREKRGGLTRRPLSPEAAAQRKPLPLAVRVGALQDAIDTGMRRSIEAAGERPGTLAALRRHLVAGARLRLVETVRGPQAPDSQGRTVLRWQSNALVLRLPDGRESRLPFTSAADFSFTEDGFAVLLPPSRLQVGRPVGARYVYEATP